MAPFKKRDRKHKHRQKQNESRGAGGLGHVDANAVELLPAEQAAHRRQYEEERAELKSQQPKISSKKKKRLDKYTVCFQNIRALGALLKPGRIRS